MFKIAVVGDKDSVMAFRALGMDIFEAEGADESRKIIDRLAKDRYGVIFITEQVASLIPETIDRYNKIMTPAVILIPSNRGSLNIGLKKIDENVEKAIGSNIL